MNRKDRILPGTLFGLAAVWVILSSTGILIPFGEITRGGAHSVEWKILADHYVLRVSVGRGIHPVTGMDWEGVGVIADAEIASDRALDAALKILREGQNATGRSK